MNRFAALLDRLAYEPARLGKLALLEAYFRDTPDPDRGWALAAMTGALSFKHAKAGLIRDLAAQNADPVLFALSYDFVGDLAETVALMWTPREGALANTELTITDVVEALSTMPKAELPERVGQWLDRLDENGRWALLKLITGALRIGVSARLARTALARLGKREPDEIEDVWHADAPPYPRLFAWLEGRAEAPSVATTVRFYPPMLSHAIEPPEFAALNPAEFCAEWKWDGIRVQAAAGRGADGARVARLYSRTGEEISNAFPDIVAALDFSAVLDGELLIRKSAGRVADFNTLQQRLNRKAVTAKLMADYPAFIRCYDVLAIGDEDVRALTFAERRKKLEALIEAHPLAPIDLSPLVPFATWDELTAARADPASHGAGEDADAIEGVMIKRRDAPYLAGRPKGYWFKWKLDPRVVDAVLMYAQRGHGKRSSFYSDYTFGVWRGEELTPVGKAYFGFTDEELAELDRFVRNNTVNRFGPVREVTHEKNKGLVLEVAFEGLQRSTRHKSGVAMRFPRIARIRWDKAPRDADTLETLEKMLAPSAS